MDDRLLADRFERIAVRFDEQEPPALDALRARSVRRRHRRTRRRLVLVAAAVAAVVGIGVAAFARTGDGPSQRLVTDPGPSTTTTTTSVPLETAGEDVLTMSVVPDGLAFEYCGLVATELPVAYCRFDEPTRVPSVDGLTVSVDGGPLSDELRSAWDRRDAEAVRALVTGTPDPGSVEARFVRLGGVDVVALGVTDVVSGESLGLPDRVSRTFLLVTDGASVQIGAEAISDEQVGEVVAGLGMAPVHPGLDPGAAVLPQGAQLLIQGPRPRWVQPDEFDPSQSSPAAGERWGALYRVPGARNPLGIEIATGVDAEALLDSLQVRSVQVGGAQGAEPLTVGGRPAVRVPTGTVAVTGQPFDQGSPSILVAADDRTLVQVSGDSTYGTQLVAIAEAVVERLP